MRMSWGDLKCLAKLRDGRLKTQGALSELMEGRQADRATWAL